MNAKTETENSGLDTVKLIAAVLVLLAGFAGFYYFSEQHIVLRVLGILSMVGLSAFIALQTAVGRGFWGFIGESRTEVRKVVWPTRQETIQTSLIVLVAVILVGIMLWLMDMFLLWAVRLLTGQG